MINEELLLRRKIEIFLQEWKKRPNKLPLIINGARQIGKTTSIQNFGKTFYKSFVEINFILNPVFQTIFDNGYSTENVIQNISMINLDAEFIDGETLIFFDELQSCPKAVTCLKAFAIEGKYDIICSGSLMGIHYESILSTSAGYKEDYQMHSLDFEEFLWGIGYKESQIESLYDNLINLKPISASTHEIMNKYFLYYIITGGLPRAVKYFISDFQFKQIFPVHKESLKLIQEDIMKHVIGLDKAKVLEVFNSIPAQLSKENKKFQFSKLNKKRFDNYIGCIEWLLNSEVILKCDCLTFPDLPFNGYIKNSTFKIYYSDTGILISSFDEETQKDIIAKKNIGVYNGAIYENIIASSLTKQNYKLYYYKRDDSTLEIDFIVRNTNYIIPIEVKTTSGNSKSLNTIIESEKYPLVKFGIKFGDYNIGYKNKILTLPSYLSFLLRRFLNECEKFENEETI